MPAGRLRYWAAARAAAGVAEEAFCAETLAAALAEAGRRHGPALTGLLARCSFLVDGEPVGQRDPAAVRLADAATVEVLPPFAGGAPTGLPAALPTPRPTGPEFPGSAGRQRSAGLGTAAVALAVAAAGYTGRPVLAGVVFCLQALLALAWLAALDVPGSLGGFAVSAAAAAAADTLLALAGGSGIGRLVGVLGLAMLVALGHQLVRRRREKVTESLAGTLSAVLLICAAATLIGLRGLPAGRVAVIVTAAGAGAGLLLARLVHAVAPRPAVVAGCARGWPGLFVGIAAAFGAGALAGSAGGLALLTAGELGLITGAVALAADVAVDLGRWSLAGGGRERQLAALTPLTALLPFVVACPVAYAAAGLMLR